ncbi:acyl-CoA dehydrogenase family protein [Albimonas pacifica]|uniref:Acyl-[acyl-carrier-protein] dehydrogenase MbtN n=1 Tax=Albimonas pacifica TaxID=1114924 RepID=A0A1I3FCE7_9RHOB|nr:acyl-CoA dehydrogenase family protein [Albimonas pacifica]SFI08867.1 acyl-CoA dehydrogenase/long-chain-acyl-CoA dehydrogenase [Albimonas pacifica]
MRRTLFEPEHEFFRDTVRKYFETEFLPRNPAWEAAGEVPREAWRAMGEQGWLCTLIPEAYGGAGVDERYAAILLEEQYRLGLTGPGWSLHSDIIAPYLLTYGTEEQKREWLPRMATGEAIAAIGMTEPSGGSDVKALRTTAKRDGNGYVLNGQKTFISNGSTADLVVVAAKTDPSAGARGVSLFLVDTSLPGFRKGRKLEKIGTHAADTSELFFDDVRLPGSALLGEEGRGFGMLMSNLPWERLIIAINTVAVAEAAMGWALEHVKQRQAFGGTLFDLQNTRFQLARCAIDIEVGHAFIDRCLAAQIERELTPEEGAMAKLWGTEMQDRVLDICLQLHGGYGYMKEYPISRLWADSRYQRIAGGASEVMLEIVGRSL